MAKARGEVIELKAQLKNAQAIHLDEVDKMRTEAASIRSKLEAACAAEVNGELGEFRSQKRSAVSPPRKSRASWNSRLDRAYSACSCPVLWYPILLVYCFESAGA